MLQRPMADAIADLPVSDNVRSALLGEPDGEPNRERLVLDAMTAHERGAWDESAAVLEQLGVEPGELAAAYTDALHWARELSQIN